MKKTFIAVGIISLIVLVIYIVLSDFSIDEFHRNLFTQELPDRQTEQSIQNDGVPRSRATKTSVSKSIIAIGLVKPKVGAEVKVGSRISGVLKRLYVSIGDKVAKGELLAELTSDEQYSRIEFKKAEIDAARIDLKYNQVQLKRFTDLKDSTETDVAILRRDVDLGRARLRQLEAKLKEDNILLDYTKIKAPVSGTIASVSTNEGESVSASLAAPTFVTIVDLERLEIQAFVDETDISKIQTGEEVVVTLDTFPGAELIGTVRAINPKAAVTNNVVNYIVIIDIVDTPDFIIRPDMTARVRFILDRRDNTINVSRKSILRKDNKQYLIINRGGKWDKHIVKVGIQNSGQVEILEGLTEGEVYMSDKQYWLDMMADKK